MTRPVGGSGGALSGAPARSGRGDGGPPCRRPGPRRVRRRRAGGRRRGGAVVPAGRGPRAHRHLADEAEPPPDERPDQALTLPVVADGPARRRDAAAERRVGDEAVAPDAVEQLVLGDDAVAVLDQVGEDVEDLRLERDVRAPRGGTPAAGCPARSPRTRRPPPAPLSPPLPAPAARPPAGPGARSPRCHPLAEPRAPPGHHGTKSAPPGPAAPSWLQRPSRSTSSCPEPGGTTATGGGRARCATGASRRSTPGQRQRGAAGRRPGGRGRRGGAADSSAGPAAPP